MIHGIVPTLAEGGKIKIGGLGAARKSKSGGEYRMPVKLDHFVVTKTTRDERGDLSVNGELMAALAKDQDGHVRGIPIVVHSDVIDEVFPTAYASYAGKKLYCRGDGREATRWEIKDGNRTGVSKPCACPCKFLGATSGPVCKPHGTLHCSIVAPGQAVAGSVYRWRTTSIISIQQMIGSLEQILATCGTMRGMPLWLSVDAIRVNPPGVPASTVYCCHVELRASDLLGAQKKALELAQMREALSGGRALPEYRTLLLPPASETESDEEQAEVAEEFYPPEDSAQFDPLPPPPPTAGTVKVGRQRRQTVVTPIQHEGSSVSPKEEADLRFNADTGEVIPESEPKRIRDAKAQASSGVPIIDRTAGVEQPPDLSWADGPDGNVGDR
jgi:hypothetical protein